MLFCVTLCVFVCPLGTGEGDVDDAEKLLQPYLKKYPKVLTWPPFLKTTDFPVEKAKHTKQNRTKTWTSCATSAHCSWKTFMSVMIIKKTVLIMLYDEHLLSHCYEIVEYELLFFGQGSIFLFFAGRIEVIKGNLDAVSDCYSYAIHKK